MSVDQQRKVVRAGAPDVDEKRVLIIHPAPMPYRVALFNELARWVDLTVLFLNPVEERRSWKDCLDRATFDFAVCASRNFKIFGKSVSFSKLPPAVDPLSFDQVLVSANPQDYWFVHKLLKLFKANGRRLLGWNTLHKDYCWFQGTVGSDLLNNLIRKRMERMLRMFDAVISYHSAGAEWVRSLGVPSFYPATYYPLRDEYGEVSETDVRRMIERRCVAKTLRLLILSHVEPRKGIAEALAVAREHPDVEVRIGGVGERSYMDSMVRIAPRNVTFCGYLSASQKKMEFSNAHALWFPTRKEAWGFVVNEAMYFGLPVISTRNAPAAVDLVEPNISGFLYNDIQELNTWLVGAKKRIPDFSQMGLAAKRRIDTFNDEVLAAFCALFSLKSPKQLGH